MHTVPHPTHPWRAPTGPAPDDIWWLVDRGSLLTALDVDDPTDLLDEPDPPTLTQQEAEALAADADIEEY